MSNVFIFHSLNRPCGFDEITSKRSDIKIVRVNMVAPGLITTDMTFDLRKQKPGIESLIPLGRYGQACEVAEAVCFLLESTYMTGQVFSQMVISEQ